MHVITQNIDDLHERAGSKNVIHLHGNIRFAKSSHPDFQEKKYYLIDGWKLIDNDLCPAGYRLRPHVVWFGEDVPEYSNALKVISQADILIVIGTSLQVYPASGLIHYANKAHMKYLIDLKPSEMNSISDFVLLNMGASEGMIYILDKIKKVT